MTLAPAPGPALPSDPVLEYLAQQCDAGGLRELLAQGFDPWAHDARGTPSALSLLASHGKVALPALEAWLEFAGPLAKRPWPADHPPPLRCILPAGIGAAPTLIKPLLEAGLPPLDPWGPGGGPLEYLFPLNSPQTSTFARWEVACLLARYEPKVAQWLHGGTPLWIFALGEKGIPDEMLGDVLNWPGIARSELDWRRNQAFEVHYLLRWADEAHAPTLKAAGITLQGRNWQGLSLFGALMRQLQRQALGQKNPFGQPKAVHFPAKRVAWMEREHMVDWEEVASDGQSNRAIGRALLLENAPDLEDALRRADAAALDAAITEGDAGKGRSRL